MSGKKSRLDAQLDHYNRFAPTELNLDAAADDTNWVAVTDEAIEDNNGWIDVRDYKDIYADIDVDAGDDARIVVEAKATSASPAIDHYGSESSPVTITAGQSKPLLNETFRPGYVRFRISASATNGTSATIQVGLS